jgi:type VI secretion system secreted protein VgrG
MPLFANQDRFALQIPAVTEEVRVVGFSFQHRISTPFVCELEVVCQRRDLPLAQWLGKAALLILIDQHHPRYIQGEIVSLAQAAVGTRFTTYHITLRPKLWLLGLRSGMRIFQNQSAVEIIKTVLKEAGIDGNDVQWLTQQPYNSREYCVQYRETDLAFVSRLMEEEGLFYFFQHQAERHRLIIADSNCAFKDIPGVATLPYGARSGRVAWQESVYELESELQRSSSGVVTLRGKSDCIRLMTGNRVHLSQHIGSQWNQEYIVRGLQMQGRQPQVLEEGASAEGSEFSASFDIIPATQEHKAEQTIPRPNIAGVQTAMVTGPAGEEIYSDRLGRVKVQFHWDRQGQHNQDSSCWLRTSQAWAGNQWGSISLPRVGQEVIVSFLHGNPDWPLITGAVYNGKSLAPYDLPTHKTRTTFKSQTSPGGDGFNELRMDDKKGAEQLFIHAQNALDMYVKNDRCDSIDRDRHSTVTAAAFEQIGNDFNCTIRQNKNIKIEQVLSQQIGGDYQQKTGERYVAKAALDFSLKAGADVMLEAGLSLHLKAGGGSIVLNPAGVAINASQVRINSGGSAGSAPGAAPSQPGSASPVDAGCPGYAIARRR